MKLNIKKVGASILNFRILFFSFLFLIPFALIRMDNDTWFLLNTGKYITQNGFPNIEPFSIHQGLAFLPQQWLSTVVLYELKTTFGVTGMLMVTAALFAFMGFLFYKLCMTISKGNKALSLFVSVIAYVGFSPFFSARPYVFSGCIFTALLYILELYMTTKKKRYLCMVPLLSLLLINLHASMWPLLFLFILPYFLDSFNLCIAGVYGEKRGKRPLILTTIICALVGFLNPSGISAMTYLFRSYGKEEINLFVAEMAPATLTGRTGITVFVIMIAIMLLLIYCAFHRRPVRIRFFCLSIGTGLMAFMNIRNLLFFSICGALLCTDAFCKKEEMKVPSVESQKSKKNVTIALTVIMCLALLSLSGDNLAIQNKTYPKSKQAIDVLLKTDTPNNIRLYTGYDEGGYAQYCGIKTYIDQRAEVYLKSNNRQKDIFKEYIRLQAGRTNYQDFLNTYDFNYLLIGKADILYEAIKYDANYNAVYKDKGYALYEKVKGSRNDGTK